MRKSRCLSRLLAVAVAVIVGLPGATNALGLGAAIGDPVIGDALQIQVPITGSRDRQLNDSCVSVRRPARPIDPDNFPGDLAVRTENSAGSQRLLIASRDPIRQPRIQFAISIACGYDVVGEYLLSVSPRNESLSPASTASKTIVTLPTLAATLATDRPLPDGLSGSSEVLVRDMTLEQLARQHFPGPLRQERFMRWVVESNESLFTNGDVRRQRLAVGTRVLIPEGVPPRRAGDYENGSSPLDKLSKPGTATVPKVGNGSVIAAKREADTSKDQLLIGRVSGQVAKQEETFAPVQRLQGAPDRQAVESTAVVERIRQVEAEAVELKGRIVYAETEAQRHAGELEALRQVEAQRTQKEPSKRVWWQIAIAALVGGVLTETLRRGYRRLVARRSAPERPRLKPLLLSVAATVEAPLLTAKRGQELVLPIIEGAASCATICSMPSPAARKPKSDKDMRDFQLPPFLQEEARRITTHGATLATVDASVQKVPDQAKAAIELANIMTSMGLIDSAVQTLVDYIREDPRQSLQHWLKLLELYRLNDMREEYERSSMELCQHFNVQAENWHGGGTGGRDTLEAYPHILAQIVDLWRSPSCVNYLLHSLLKDNRQGTRSGFPLPVVEEIHLLIAIRSDVQ